MVDFKHILEALNTDLDPAARQGIVDGLKFVASTRSPDVLIRREENGPVYMERWWLVPRRKYDFNVYLHHFLRSDYDEALHDHPWANVSVILEGEYLEEVPRFAQDPSGARIKVHRKAGEIVYRDPEFAHRVELFPDHSQYKITGDGRKPVLGCEKPVWTLFITGPKVREWGFWCKSGWRDWKKFTGQDDSNGPVRDAAVSVGCGED